MRQLVELPGPVSRYSVRAVDWKGDVLLAAEERGDCVAWRLLPAFWEVVRQVEQGTCGGGRRGGWGVMVIGGW